MHRGKVDAHSDENLPSFLGPEMIKSGLSGTREAAKRCGEQHGAGVKVPILFVVEGETGTILSAEPSGEDKTSPLVKCVVAAEKTAKFSKFQKDSQKLEFRFSM